MKRIFRIMGRIAALLGKIVAAAVMALIAAALTGYLFTPVYDFAESGPFAGDKIYNPYEGVDFGQAKKAVLHFHTTMSDGKDAPETIVGAYRDMGYEIVSVADHDRVTSADIEPSRELGTYEHGLNAYRFHNVVFGAEKPLRFQLPLWQGVSGREEILRRLSGRFPVVVLNHPAGVRALTADQMERLSHYDYLEADRSMDREMPMWDAGLSAGHYSYIMANDDLHDLGRRYPIGRAMTFIMTSSADSASVMKALEAGHTYAVRVARPAGRLDSVYIPKVERVCFTGAGRVANSNPNPNAAAVAGSVAGSGDTLCVAFSDPADVRFIGQGGRVEQEAKGVREACYVFTPDDTYIRVEARFDSNAGGTTIYFNPLARYTESEDRPVNADYTVLNTPKTVLSVALHALLMLALVGGIYLLFFGKRKSRRVK